MSALARPRGCPLVPQEHNTAPGGLESKIYQGMALHVAPANPSHTAEGWEVTSCHAPLPALVPELEHFEPRFFPTQNWRSSTEKQSKKPVNRGHLNAFCLVNTSKVWKRSSGAQGAPRCGKGIVCRTPAAWGSR